MNVSFTLQTNALITTFVAVIVLFFGVTGSVSAQANAQINYQGKLTDSSGVAVPDGTYNMNFWLVASGTAPTSTAVWSESLTGSNRVQVTNGLFSVMLGSTSALTSVDFNQTLYLGVEIGGTSTPAWDGEMTPRKILGTVPAAFVAGYATVAGAASSSDNASTLGGVASSSFLRSDDADTMSATSSGTLLSVIQNGAGAIARFFSGVTEVFTILSNGNVGVGTSTPSERFTVAGNVRVTGTSTLATTTISQLTLSTALSAINGGTGLSSITQNQLLIGGAGNTWTQVATSSLGLGNGTFLGLTDTPSAYTANRLLFTNSAGNAVTDSASLVFTGTNFGIGSTTPSSPLTVVGNAAIVGSVIAPIITSTSTLLIDSNTTSALNIGTGANAKTITIGNTTGASSLVLNSGTGAINIGTSIAKTITIGNTTGATGLVFDSGTAGTLFSNGNVAMGTTSTTSRLTVQGVAGTADVFRLASSTGAVFFTAAANGNIGIGSTTPAARLTVVGAAGNSNVFTFASSTGSSLLSLTSTGRLVFGTSTAADIFINGGATTTNPQRNAYNIAIGGDAFIFSSSTALAQSNIALGHQALRGSSSVPMTGDYNFAAGFQALQFNTSGQNNTGIGYRALLYNTTGSNNIAIGDASLASNSTGSHNIGLGQYSLSANTTGRDNIAFGYEALTFSVTGSSNIAFGRQAMAYNESGSQNIAFGEGSLINNYNGSYNNALGYLSLSNYNGTGTIGIGYQAGDALTEGNRNIIIGYDVDFDDASTSLALNIGNLIYGTNLDGTGTTKSSGNIGIGTSTPSSKLTVAGDINLTGALRANGNAGTAGMVLQTTGTGVQWVATSSLGISGGASTFLALTDTPSSYTANRILFTNSGASALTDSANFTFDGTQLAVNGDVRSGYFTATSTTGTSTFAGVVGIGTTTPTARLTVVGVSGASDIVRFASSTGSTLLNLTATGRLGLGTTTPSALLSLMGTAGQTNNLLTISSSTGASLFSVLPDGSLDVDAGGIYYDATTRQTSIESLNLGAINFADDAGAISWVDMAVTSAAATGTVMSYTAQLDANPLLTIYGESAGGGNVQNLRVGIGSTTPSSRLSVVAANGTDALFTFASSTGSSLLSLTSTGRLVFGTSTAADIFINGGATTTNPQRNAHNIAIGNNAFVFSSSTSLALSNIAIGWDALQGSSTVLMTGRNNIAIGEAAGLSNTTGRSNVFIGYIAGLSNTTGRDNVFIGTEAGVSNTTGSSNIFTGNFAGSANTTGFSNIFTGEEAGTANTTGSHNIFTGYWSGWANTTGSNNIFSGYFAGVENTTGSNNVALGNQAGTGITTGTSTTYLGAFADTFSGSISTSTAIGAGALLARSNTMVLGGIGANAVDIVSGTSTPWAKLSLMNNFGSTNALFDIATTTSAAFATSSLFRVGADGRVGIGSSTPSSLLTVAGTANITGAATFGSTLSVTGNTSLTNASSSALTLSGRLYDGANSAGTSGMVLQSTGTSVQWVATSSLGITGGASTFLALTDTPSSFTANRVLFTNSGASALTDSANFTFDGTQLAVNGDVRSGYFTATSTTGTSTFAGVVGIGTTTPSATLAVIGKSGITPFFVASSTGTQLLTLTQSGALGLGTSTPYGAGLTIERTGLSGTTTAGIGQYLTFSNSVAAAQQFGDNTYISASNTATTTLLGSFLRIQDNSVLGNTVRGFEVQADLGANTLGENTAISGYARTLGVRGYTSGDAGGTIEPAGVYGETGGTSQGNAIRGYSSTITTAALLKLFQDSSTFTGTGLLMNFGNAGGSFSSTTASKFIDLKNAGTSMFTVGAYGMLTIGDGTTSQNAGIQVGYGGICVDNDGSCSASTTGRITAVSYTTANSDLAENYFTSEDVKPGEVVFLKGGLSVGRATRDEATKVIGVVSTAPGLTMGENDTSLAEGERAVPIGLAGRVPVRVSNENGEVKAGDELMLSSIPGVVMKASSTGYVIGRALEDFDATRAYGDTYINQFGDNIIVPEYTPINRESDPRVNDGCYYGGGNRTGAEPCIPLTATTTEAQYDEADRLVAEEAKLRALNALARVVSDEVTINTDTAVQIGQIVMFIDLRYRYLDEDGMAMVAALLASTTEIVDGEAVSSTLWQRLVGLAENFVDGVLSVFTLKADRVETNQLCVDGVCVNANDLRQLLNNAQTPTDTPEIEPAPLPLPVVTEPVPVSEPEPEPIMEDAVATTTEEVIEPSVEEVDLIEPETTPLPAPVLEEEEDEEPEVLVVPEPTATEPSPSPTTEPAV